ncbi:phosphotransferase [Cellulomonas hominis]
MPCAPLPEPAVDVLLARGREAHVWVVDDDRVLRRHLEPRDVGWEVAVMRHARAHGVPVPAVHSVHDSAMVLDRLAGPTLLTAMLAGEVTAAAGGALLAELQGKVHAVPLAGLVGAERAGAGDVLTHRDLHPANVMLTPTGPVVIDWAGARVGPAAVDVALTALLLAEVTLVGIGSGAGDLVDLVVDPEEIEVILRAYLAAAPTSPAAGLASATTVREPVVGAAVAARAADVVRGLLGVASR